MQSERYPLAETKPDINRRLELSGPSLLSSTRQRLSIGIEDTKVGFIFTKHCLVRLLGGIAECCENYSLQAVWTRCPGGRHSSASSILSRSRNCTTSWAIVYGSAFAHRLLRGCLVGFRISLYLLAFRHCDRGQEVRIALSRSITQNGKLRRGQALLGLIACGNPPMQVIHGLKR